MSHSQWTCTTSITDLLRQGKRSCGTFLICNVFFNHCETSIAGITNEIAVGLEVWFLVKLTWKFNLEWSFGRRQTQIFCNQILSFRQGAWQLNSIHHYYVDVWLSHANLWVSPLLFIVFFELFVPAWFRTQSFDMSSGNLVRCHYSLHTTLAAKYPALLHHPDNAILTYFHGFTRRLSYPDLEYSIREYYRSPLGSFVTVQDSLFRSSEFGDEPKLNGICMLWKF